jgi:Bacterial membrane protein YfhO
MPSVKAGRGPIVWMRRETLAAIVLFFGAALYFVLVELHRPGMPAFDVYVYFIPNKLHAAWSLWRGGKGLLWNPYQSCGEPFFANPTMGLLYPPHLAFAVLEANTAVHVVLIFNMVLGAIGMFLLTRELGLGWVAALGGALAFELGDPMAQLTGWSPTHSGPWTWLPWALLLCERLLRAPNRLRVVGLAVVLTLELLPGWVLIAALTYQLIALRILWALVTAPRERPWRAAGAVAVGLALAPLLAAVQLLPAAEFARESFRLAVEALEFAKLGSFETTLLKGIRLRTPPVPFTIVVFVLAGVAPLVSPKRRLVTFYLLTGALYSVLALGTATPLYGLYVTIPPGASTLKYPWRLWWLTSFCLAMLTAFCLDGLASRSGQWSTRWLAVAAATLVAGALTLFVPGGLRGVEILALAGAVAAVLLAAVRPGLGRTAAWLAVGVMLLNLVAVPMRYRGNLLPSAAGLWRHREAFAALDPPITAQDRVLVLPGKSTLFDLTLLRKTATVLRVPDLNDYDALLGRRFADYFAALWPRAAQVTTTEDFLRALAPSRFQPRLLDLASIRYVITSPPIDIADHALDLPLVPPTGSGLRFYRNDAALPRARYVPRVEVIADPPALLDRLAHGTDDLASIAFVEAAMPSGFTGTDVSAAAATTRIVTNDPEHLVIDVDAPAPGFLVLADQYFPGWRATVNGIDVPIHRANYMFRLIEVPAGASRVDFRYRPAAVAVGGAVSLVTLGILAAVTWRARRRN